MKIWKSKVKPKRAIISPEGEVIKVKRSPTLNLLFKGKNKSHKGYPV